MYQPTVTEMTDYEAFLDPSSFMYQDACVGQFYTRRSNSRSGYRLFARVAHRGPGSGSRMPSRESVYSFFTQFGPVMDCYLPESATNVAYLCFDDEGTMEHVLALPEHLLCIEGVYVTLSRASPRPDYSMNNTDRVFVKNCPDSTTRTALRNYFSQFGLVTDVYIPKDKVTGEQKKFAFVTFGSVDSARSAISFGETHRLVYIDRMSNMLTTAALQVMPAEPRPASSSTGLEPLSAHQQGKFTRWSSSSSLVDEDAFTTASSTLAPNTPSGRSSGMTVEAAASVLINALTSHIEVAAPSGSPLSSCSDPSSCNTSELEEIIAKLNSLSLADMVDLRSVTPAFAPSPELSSEESSTLTQLIEETLSRQSSLASEVNIFEQFLNPNWESRE